MGDKTQSRGETIPSGSEDPLNRVGSDLRATADEVKSQAGDVASRVRDEAAGVFADVRAEAASVVDEARDKAASFAEAQKDAGVKQAESLARAVHRAADELQDSSPQLAHYVREAAASVRQLAQTMQGRNLSELVGEVESMARRQPVAFFGAAVLAGFAISRFVKSSSAATQRGVPEQGGHGEGTTSAQSPHWIRVTSSVAAQDRPAVTTPGQAGQVGRS